MAIVVKHNVHVTAVRFPNHSVLDHFGEPLKLDWREWRMHRSLPLGDVVERDY